jgi:hypothetical protein
VQQNSSECIITYNKQWEKIKLGAEVEVETHYLIETSLRKRGTTRGIAQVKIPVAIAVLVGIVQNRPAKK